MRRPLPVGLAHLALLLPAFAGGASPAGAETVSTIRAQGPAMVKARTAALLVSDMSGGSVRTSVLALPWTGSSDDPGEAVGDVTLRSVRVRLEIDGDDLMSRAGDGERGEAGASTSGEDESPMLEIFVYGLGSGNEVLDARSLRLELDPRVRREFEAGRGLAVDFTLELPPGEHRLRHLVWTDSQRFGLGTTPIEVPDSAESPPVVWIPASPDHWLQVTPPGEGGASPRQISAGGLSPTSLAVLSLPEAEERAVVEAWWQGPEGEVPEGAVRLEPDATVDFSSPEDPIEVPFEVVERSGDSRVGRGRRVRFPVPEVPPGRYRLIVQPRDGAPSLPLPVVVAPAAAGGVWTRVLPSLGQPGGSEPSPARTRPRTVAEGAEEQTNQQTDRQTDRRAICRRDYRDAVVRWVDGDAEGAAVELARREREIVEAVGRQELDLALQILSETQRQAAAWLAGAEAEGAVALSLLQARVAQEHFRAGRWFLADRSVEQAVWLAEGLAAVRDTAQARRDAAGLLLSMAAELLEAGRPRRAERLFQRALELEASEAALLGLAVVEELAGEPSEAVQILERLVRRAPGHREGRLRLAVNLRRLGHTDRARQVLWDLVGTADLSWVTAVAYQELAGLDLEQGECERAVHRLRRARGLFPDQPQLAVQMAWALECAGRHGGARNLVAEIVARARRDGAGGESARTRYARWSDETLAADRRRLGELAQLSRQSLAESLDRSGTAGP